MRRKSSELSVSGDIQPWKEESSRLPKKILRSMNMLEAHPKKKKVRLDTFLKFYKTEQSTKDQFSNTFNHLFLNQATSKDQNNSSKDNFNMTWVSSTRMPSNLKLKFKCDLQSSWQKQDILMISRKRGNKNMEIKSLKKKIIKSQLLDGMATAYLFQNNGIEDHSGIHLKTRFITESKLQKTRKQVKSQPKLSPLIKKIELRVKMKDDKASLMTEVAAILKEKCKILENRQKTKIQQNGNPEQSYITREIVLQRQLFLKHNNKFQNWQNKNKKLFASSVIFKNKQL